MGPSLELGRYFPDRAPPQEVADVAVVIPTIMRPSIVDAVRCIYGQDLGGRRVQIAIGADQNPHQTEALYATLAARPDHVSAIVVTPPYSTSVRHGGVHLAKDGGALRSILSFMANARTVAYLDDDNAWLPNHLAGLLDAIQGKAWAFSHRMLVDEETGEDLGVDRWDSVGPGKGRFAAKGGFVDTNCLLVDKVAVGPAFGLWSDPGKGVASIEADRRFVRELLGLPYGEVASATVRYFVRSTNLLHTFIRDGVEF